MDKIEINKDCKIIIANNATLNDSVFVNVAMVNVKITNANLSDLEIEGAQLGGAYIHNIGAAPKGHPAYDPNFIQRPLRFEDCDLKNSTIINCNLSDMEISYCNTGGMKINGVLVDELLKAYHKQ